MRFAELVAVSQQVAATSKRLLKIDLLAALLRQLNVREIEIAVAFLSGTTLQGKTGVGYAALRKAVAEPAVEARLDLSDVDDALARLSQVRGGGADRMRMGELQSLLARATAPEQQFLGELLLGGLRQGALEGMMLDALATAFGAAPAVVRRAAMMAGELPRVARALAESGPAGLAAFDIQLFAPVQPMLAQPVAGVEDALELMPEAALEYKLDGARIQVHRRNDEVRVYTRALNDVTVSVPEVVEATLAIPANELILDGEVISFAGDGRPQPFQVTMRRFGRRVVLDRLREELPLTPVWFDLLYLDGESFVDRPQAERFGALSRLVPGVHLVPNLVARSREAGSAFLSASLEAGHEGIVAKDVRSPYAAGSRGASWLKIKKAHTLDLVILAAEWGSGRRKGWLSNLHLGARDTESGGFAMLGKTFKGLTDEMLRWQTEQLLALETSRDSYTVYVEPKLLAEIAYNDIQTSPRYKSGFALRFARVKRYRTDKTAAEADTFETVKKLASFAASGGVVDGE